MTEIGRPVGNSLQPILVQEELMQGQEMASATADAVLQAGIARGHVSAELVDLANGLMPEGRPAALILPLHSLFARHAILEAAGSPATRIDSIFVTQKRGGFPSEELSWKKGLHGISYSGRSPNYTTFGIDNDVLLARSEEELSSLMAWEEERRAALEKLAADSPAGEASSLLETAFGGVDITNPERAVREFTTVMLTATAVELQHANSPGYLAKQARELVESRVATVFGRRHSEAFATYLQKVQATATMALVDGAVNTDRLAMLAQMLGEDTGSFLGQVALDLKRLVLLEQHGRQEMGEISDALRGFRR
jgi:hypothetical protein